MDVEEWLALFVIMCWSVIPLILDWIQVVLLLGQVDPSILVEHPKSPDSGKDLGRGAGLSVDYPMEDHGPSVLDLFDKPVWLPYGVMDTLVFSRRWYALLKRHAWMLPPAWLWIPIKIALVAVRIVSNFFVWYRMSDFPEVLFGFLVTQTFLAVLYESTWFSTLFKLQCIHYPAVSSAGFLIAFAALYGARGAYVTDVGFGFATVEVLYYLYVTCCTVILLREKKYLLVPRRMLYDIELAPAYASDDGKLLYGSSLRARSNSTASSVRNGIFDAPQYSPSSTPRVKSGYVVGKRMG
jgi:hypothetical protein